MKIDFDKTQILNIASIPTKLGFFVWVFIKRHPVILFIFSLFILFEGFLASANAYLLKSIIDGVIISKDNTELFLWIIATPVICYASIKLLMNVLYSIYRYAHLLFFPKLKSDIAGTVHHYLTEHSYRYFSDHLSGSLAKRIFDLCTGVESLIQIMTHFLLPKGLSILVASIVMYMVNPIFGVLQFVWSISFVGTSFWMSKRSENLAYALSEAGTKMNGRMVDSIVNIMSTKLFANKKFEEDIVFDSINTLMKKDRALDWYLLKVNIVQGLWILALVCGMFAGLIYGRLQGWVTVGDFALIITLSAAITDSIYGMGQEMLRFSKEMGNCRQALNIIAEPHEIMDKPNAGLLEVKEGKIVFDKVQFQYEGAPILFENKTVVIEPGQKVGLVGHSGSGKSTFVNLILRLYDVKEGSILIDNVDIKEVTQNSLRQNIGMIPQDPSLFHRSLLENIQCGKIDAPYDEVIQAAIGAHAHEFITALPKQYDSLVGERGVKLSGGQRQRIAIARAFLKNAPILILDEATSQLDSVTEQLIQDSLWKLMHNKTTIVVAHRLSTLLKMDRILVFDKGKIVEDGKHDVLLAQNGLYATLWKAQIGGFLLDDEEA